MIRLPALANDYKPIPITDFGFGLMTREPPTQIPHGAAIVSRNCDYDSRNVQNRKGFASILENGPGAVKVADFESGEAWAGGSADTINFVLVEAAADGLRGRQISAVGGAGETAITLTVALNLGTDLLEVFHLWAKTTALPAGITAYSLTLRFQTSVGNYWQATIAAQTDLNNLLELGLSKYHRFRRQDFAKTGTPDWTNITQIRLGLTATGTGTLTITADNLHRSPGLIQDLFQFRRESGTFRGAANEYAVAAGTLYQNNGRRWASVFSGFNAAAQVYSYTMLDRQIITDGVTTPRLLMDDGTTVYRLGIVTPPKQMTATQITLTAAEIAAGGGLPDGKYFAQMLWYSSKTGAFSAPDDRTPTKERVTIAAGGGTAGIRFSNIPVSADPQVDWVVVGIRPETEPELFFRISDGLFGDVANGTATVDFKGSLATLQARAASVIDPDMDYPSVIDPATGLPVEAHPLYLASIGNYLVTVMKEQPTVVRWSRFRAPTSWRLDDEQPLGENDSEPVRALATLSSALLTFKRNAVYPARAVGGDEGIRFEDPISDRGTFDHKAVLAVGHVLLYPGEEGVYLVAVDLIPKLLTAGQQPSWGALWDNFALGQRVGAVIRERHQVVHFGRSLGALRNDVGWVTHYRTVVTAEKAHTRWPEWAPSVWTAPADQAAEVRTPVGYESWVAGKGQVYRLNYGGEDDGRAIDFQHRTGLISADPHYIWLYNWLDLELNVAGDFDLTVKSYMGTALNADGTALADLQGTAAVLGPFILGTSLLGAPLYRHQRLKLPPKAVRYFSADLSFRGRGRVELFRMSAWAKRLSRWRPTM